jgi:hypothetical protein
MTKEYKLLAIPRNGRVYEEYHETLQQAKWSAEETEGSLTWEEKWGCVAVAESDYAQYQIQEIVVTEYDEDGNEIL